MPLPFRPRTESFDLAVAGSEGARFTLVGAEVASTLLEATALGDDLRHQVLDAITLHLNPTVRPEQGMLAHLVHDGVMVDIIGARAWELDGGGVARVMHQHPRHRFIHDGEDSLRAHGRRVRGCRSGPLFQCGFGIALRVGPWFGYEARTRKGRLE